ncbi:peptidoglycan endopeptidase [Apibacter muscae]|uniref:C40 family peptidase n=1 Tax=Apibacter muscae TaxID=2509004 RepID=UPI0011AD5492|nr:NlpC/P60 family protein [Apibacter muscae]TWP24076.1 peptidoglycan endopeptidase [Apibacter muscae]
MKKILVVLLLIFFFVMSCRSRYYKDIPFKLVYNQQDIEKSLNVPKYKYSILDTLNQEYEMNLTDREVYLKEKYSIVLGVKPQEVKNYKFYDFIDQWLGTKYSGEGFTRDSLNMAPFVSALYQYTYKIKLPSNAMGMFKSNQVSLFTGRKYLEEGDILFFRYGKDSPVSDVAVYLKNNRVLTTSKRDGLIISDFNNDYFQLRYISAGRLILSEDNESN